MSDSRLQSTLREMRRHFSDPRVLGAIAIVGLIMGVAGPFGTYELLDLLPRLIYWLVIVGTTYGVGFACSVVGEDFLAGRLPQLWSRLAVIGLIAGLPITLAVVIINLVAFGSHERDVIDVVELWLYITPIAIGVMLISVLVERAVQPAAVPDAAAPALLERLPRPQRGPLLSLSVADHYVDVVTTRGHALVLMRLSDAIRETAPTAGLQIHRSHWVALDAVARAVRAEGKLFLELTDGRRLPVSRSYAVAVREAGFG